MDGQTIGQSGSGLLPKWDNHQTFTVEEFGEMFGLSRTAAYAAAKNGSVPVIRIGRRLVISRASIERLLG
jgi:Helix-turn-helix domain